MSNYSATSQYSNSGAPGNPAPSSTILSQQQFLERVDLAKSKIRELGTSIQTIASLHQAALSSPEPNSTRLEDEVTKAQLMNTSIRDDIKYLELDAVKTQDGTKSVKARQAKQLKAEFEKALKDYQQEEVAYRQRYREQIARQYKIVNPDASDAEVDEASEMDWGSEGVFQSAVSYMNPVWEREVTDNLQLKGNRTGQASSVLGAVRARHNELQRIEATLTELAAMFADMAQIVEAQDPVVEHTEQNAITTAEDVDKGNTEIDKANEHARRRNRLKWWCLLIVVLIILAIALGVGLGIGLTRSATKTA